MLTALARLGGGRRGRWHLLVAAAACAAGLSAAPALAAPSWRVTMTHHNPFGVEAGKCPSGVAEPAATPPCGIDPLTEFGLPGANGEAFPRESSLNAYTITVENDGTETAGAFAEAGETLHCLLLGGEHKVEPENGVVREFHWLRGGATIEGAIEKDYTLQAADRGKVVQCDVTEIGPTGTVVSISPGAVVAPVPVPGPPTGHVFASSHGNVAKGVTVSCTPSFTGQTSIAYQWLRNGKMIEENGNKQTYKLGQEDVGKAVQCEATASNASGSEVSVSPGGGAIVTQENPGEENPEPSLPQGKATTPVVAVTDALPPGMTFITNEHNANEVPENEPNAPVWQCETTTNTVECLTSESRPAKTSYKPIELHVHVTPQAGTGPPTNVATNIATVSGGGAGSASNPQQQGETPILPAVPFGIDSFMSSLENEEEQPVFDQAGGHPYGYRVQFAFNYTTANTRVPATLLDPAGGAPKELKTELPPGFIGNVQNFPQCPLATLLAGAAEACPANTAVGYLQQVATAGIIGTEIVKGRPELFAGEGNFSTTENSDLIYNVAPSAGIPAEFGFVLNVKEHVAIVLEPHVRSDGDYGVTVDSVSSGGFNLAELLGARLRFCESGAVMETETVGDAHINRFHCPSVKPTSKPFNRTPTQCTSPEPGKTAAPATTLHATSWKEPEPALVASIASYANAPSGPQANVNREPTKGTPVASSLMTGCQLVKFNPEVRGVEQHPELEFKPSAPSEGGSTQADEPTGLTLNLKVPQTNEAGLPATPDVKNLEMTLPEGMTVSPSGADGLQACTNAQFGLGTEFGPNVAKPTEPAKPASCPLASQIGTVEVFTPLLSGAPTIRGVPVEGGTLECSQGMWNGNPSLSYQWLSDGKPIKDATEKDYTVPSKEVPGTALQCQVNAINAGGASVAVTRDAVVVEGHGNEETFIPPPFPPSSIPAPSGTPSPGNTLTCASEPWTGEPAPALTQQWLRNGEPITGATGAKYTLTPEDEGKAIQCQITGTNTGGETIADSAAVIASPVPSPAPPLPGAPLQGQLFVGEPECSPCTEANHDAAEGRIFRQFLQVQDPSAGIIVKLHGTGSVNEQTGRLTTKFVQQPQAPFELLQLKLKGGPRAPLANPQTCGPATTTMDLTPWSAPGLGGLSGTEPVPGAPDAHPSSSFNVDFNGAGEACPGTLPFAPSFNAGTIGPKATAAGEPTNFSVTFARNDREQDLSGFTMQMPLGLVGKVPAVKKCGEAEIAAAEHNTGECPADSEIGTATTLAGPGPDPFSDTGHVYFTGPYAGAPFGVVVVTLAKSGPFNLGNVVVRSTINIDRYTAAVTITTPKLPQIVSGVPVRLRAVNVNVTRPGFMLNPTNCSAQSVTGTLDGAGGAAAQVSSPFGITGCKNLPFAPTFTASTEAHASKADGASLDVKITYPPGAYANIAKSATELPAALPSRLSTIQQACRDTVFENNPAACPEGSVVGYATARTPLLENPLTGPAYLVSHGNAAFPDLEFVLQGEGITLYLDGQTDIKGGVTKTTFNSVPDSPVSSFEVILPESPHSALAANGNLCTTPLNLPTTLTAQNGAVMKQNTTIAVTGCPPTVAITKAKLAGNAVLVTVKLSATGTVKITGKGLKTTTNRNLKAGTHQIRVALTKAGRSMRRHHKKVSLHVSLTVGKQAAVAKATTVRL